MMAKEYICPKMIVVKLRVDKVLLALSAPKTPGIEARGDEEENDWY